MLHDVVRGVGGGGGGGSWHKSKTPRTALRDLFLLLGTFKLHWLISACYTNIDKG